jgi:hypothetical protein
MAFTVLFILLLFIYPVPATIPNHYYIFFYYIGKLRLPLSLSRLLPIVQILHHAVFNALSGPLHFLVGRVPSINSENK